MGIPVLAIEGYEADDIIATLTTQARAAGFRVLAVTGDRDALQLVDDHTTVLYPRKGVSDLTRFTPEEVNTKYGLTPTQYPDYAALRGDPSDNLPGIPGVGEKTAAKWIREHGSLEALVHDVDQVKGKVGDALRENLSSVLMNRRLTELVRDVELPLGPEDLALKPWDRDRIHQLFDDRVPRPAGPAVHHAELGGARGRGRLRGQRRDPRPGLGARLARRTHPHRPHRSRVVGPQRVYGSDTEGIALAAEDGQAAWLDTAVLDPTTSPPWWTGSATRDREGDPRGEVGVPCVARAGLAAGRRHQ